MRLSTLSICVILGLVSTPVKVSAEVLKTSLNTAKHAIIDFNDAKERLINSPNFFYDAVEFYHHRIDDKAVFNITIQDTRPNMPEQKMQLGKTEFLQGFLEEGQKLNAYDQSYKINNLTFYPDQQVYMAEEHIIENAKVAPMSLTEKNIIEFSTATTCQSFYKLENLKAMQVGSNCKTVVHFPEDA